MELQDEKELGTYLGDDILRIILSNPSDKDYI